MNLIDAIAVLPPGLEQEGCNELKELGAQRVIALRRSASFQADKACFYRLHLQARLPFRFLREISRFKCDGPTDLYKGVQNSLDWESWLHPSMSFRVDVSGSCMALTHSHYSALQVKNALVDLQRKIWGFRSKINLEDPDICFHLHLSNKGAVLSLDGSGGSLHKRGYRAAMGSAPLKENLAAGLIRLSGWDGSVPLVDPVCGSGTLLIEAASLIKDSPNCLKRNFSLENWFDFNSNIWEKEKLKVKSLAFRNTTKPIIIGCESNPEIAKQANLNIRSSGLEELIDVRNINFQDFKFPEKIGTIVCNPPYGKRIGCDEDLSGLYSQLGQFLKSNASGWELWLLSGNPILTKFLRMKATKKFPISNGGIDCRWLNYSIQ